MGVSLGEVVKSGKILGESVPSVGVLMGGRSVSIISGRMVGGPNLGKSVLLVSVSTWHEMFPGKKLVDEF